MKGKKQFTKDVFLSALKLRAVPYLLRPLAAVLIPDLRRVYRHNDRARALVQPILEERERDEKAVPGYQKPSDTIQWMHDLLPEEDKHNYALQGVLQLAITGVSIQSTSKLIVNIILNLMKYTEYVPILREEIESILAECGGEWTLESMARLEKLDSFMRESLRFEPPLTGTFPPMPRHINLFFCIHELPCRRMANKILAGQPPSSAEPQNQLPSPMAQHCRRTRWC